METTTIADSSQTANGGHRKRRFVMPVAGAVLAAASASAIALGTSNPAQAAAPPEVFAGFKNSHRLGSNSQHTFSLALPTAGAYAITAKVQPRSNTATRVDVMCRLKAGSNFDETRVTLEGFSMQSISNAVVTQTTGPSTVTLTCFNASTVTNVDTFLDFTKIVATRVNSRSDVPLS
ncbi:hypothetical protein [Actinomadura sp. 6N118]|uniref:hypothetical protein n=1 Tax=Actinomadura sp. 6N118 TaxID=3375151 RepID=UPI0037AD261F